MFDIEPTICFGYFALGYCPYLNRLHLPPNLLQLVRDYLRDDAVVEGLHAFAANFQSFSRKFAFW